MIHSRVSCIFLPVERSITVSPPQRIAQVIFSTSSWMLEPSAELPMFALILTRKLRPMIIGSDSGWLMLAGMMARPLATSSRTNSGVICRGRECSEILSWMLAREQLPVLAVQVFNMLIFTYGNKLHFRSNNAATGIMHLCHVRSCFATAWLALQVEAHFRQPGISQALSAISRSRAGKNFSIRALVYPIFTQWGEPRADIYF